MATEQMMIEMQETMTCNKEAADQFETFTRGELMELKSAIVNMMAGMGKTTTRDGGTDEVEKNLTRRFKDFSHLIPKTWSHGKSDEPFVNMAHDLETYMKTVTKESAEIMGMVARKTSPVSLQDVDEDKFPNKEIIDQQLYATLRKVTEGAPKEFVRNDKRCGFEAWRKLHGQYDANTAMDESTSLGRIMEPMRGVDSEGVKLAIEKYEADIRDHKGKFPNGSNIGDAVMIHGLRKLIPDQWSEMYLKGEQFEKYDAAKTRILSIANDRRGTARPKVTSKNEVNLATLSQESAATAYEALSEYYGKTLDFAGGYQPRGDPKGGKGQPYVRPGGGKVGGKDGSRAPWWKDAKGFAPKGKSKGKGETRDCYNCGKKGHLARDCRLGKGGVNNIEEQYGDEEGYSEYQEEHVVEEPEDIGPLASLVSSWQEEEDIKWLGNLNCLDECKNAGELGLVQEEWQKPKKTVQRLKSVAQESEKKVKGLSSKLEAGPVMALAGAWEPITVTADSGAGNNVAPKNAFPWIKLEENDDSRNGRYYTTANGKRVYVLGQKTIVIKTREGIMKTMVFQICDVTRIPASVGKIMQAGNDVIMSKNGSKVIDAKGREIAMAMENGVFVIRCRVKVDDASVFTRPAP